MVIMIAMGEKIKSLITALKKNKTIMTLCLYILAFSFTKKLLLCFENCYSCDGFWPAACCNFCFNRSTFASFRTKILSSVEPFHRNCTKSQKVKIPSSLVPSSLATIYDAKAVEKTACYKTISAWVQCSTKL